MRISQTIEKQHRPDCRYSTIHEAVRTFNIRFSACVLALKKKVDTGITLSYRAGKTSISHALACHRVVDRDSPAFMLFDSISDTPRFLRKYPDLGENGMISGEKIEAELWKLLETREANPRDRLPTGHTLVHVGLQPQLAFENTDNRLIL